MTKATYREWLTVGQVREVLHYEPTTGIFTWKKLPAAAKLVKVGDIAGGPDGHRGHIRIKINGRLFFAHCLAWLWMTGMWPKDQIDHRNTIPGDNRWTNLREATHSFNMQNRRRTPPNSKTGKLGVGYSKLHGKFRARIMVNKVPHHIGYFDTVDDAHQAYITTKRVLHPGGTL